MSREQLTDRLSEAFMWAGLVVLVYLVYLVVQPFLVPLAWAVVLSVVFYPVHDRLVSRMGHGRAAAVSTLAITLILVVPAVVVTTLFIREAIDAADYVQQAMTPGQFGWIERGLETLQARIPLVGRFDVAGLVADAGRRAATFIVGQSGNFVRNFAGSIFDLVVALFGTFFVLRDADGIMQVVRQLLPLERGRREQFLTHTRDLITVSVAASGIVAAVQGFLGGVIFAALGINAPVFWGVLMAFFCLLPFGAWVVWLPTAIWLATTGDMVRATILAALGVAVVSAADNVLRPMLLSGRANMNGLVVLVGLLGGASVFGLLGLVLGPILLVTALSFLSEYAESRARD